MKKRIFYMFLAINLILSMLPQGITYASGTNWVEWSYPKNNQGTIDSERVERNPLIKIKFKHGVELIDKSKISLSSDGHIYSVDVNEDTWITYEGDILKIDVNSLYRKGKEPLRANTAYKLTIGKGVLRLKDNIGSVPTNVENEEINLYFITGDENHFANKDLGLYVEGYSSNGNKTDNIVNLGATELKEDGSIYIHFHNDSSFPRELKWNEWTAKKPVKSNEEALEYFKLYEVPKGYKKDYDPNGKIYDKEFRYDEYGKSLPIGVMDEIPLKSVEIVKDSKGNNTTILKISPKQNLIPYNKYYIKLIDKDILTDNHEKLMQGNENLLLGSGQEIWTSSSKESGSPTWEMDKISPEEIIEIEKGPEKTYNIHGASRYNEYIDGNGKPIILYVDREVIVHPRLNILNGVTLFEGYGEGDTSSYKIKIKWYRLEYFYENNIKKTKISIYPEGELQAGKYYALNINNGIFISRNGKKLDGINLRFVIEGDCSTGKDRGIYKFEITNKKDIIGSYNRPFLITDFKSTDKNIEFSITGYNFAEDIKQLRFVRETDNKTITIPKGDLKFHDVTKITGVIKGSAKSEFAKIDGVEYELFKTSAGVYDIYIDFERGNSTSTHKIDQRFIVKDRPKVIDTAPRDGERYFEPEISYDKFTNPDEEGYYIKVVFEDIGSTLKIINTINHRIQVNVIGDKTNLVDENKHLVYKRELSISQYSTNRFSIYIPLVDKLDDGQRYEVFIPEGSIVEYSDISTEKNRYYRWTFSTNYFSKAEKLYEGSVPEFYDWNYPIVIDGSMFHGNTSVEFRSMNGKYYSPSSIDIRNNNSTIYVYLPRSRRLPVGVYDIIINNGDSYETEIVYGVFSVVKEGDYVPNEEYRVKDDRSIGLVKETIGTSKDVIELSSKYTDRSYLEIDLDELMGSETWVRGIEYPVSWSDILWELGLKSKWVNVNITSLKLNNYYDEKYIELRVGRVEPSMSDMLKKKLVGKNIKSNFIEVAGTNFDFTNLTIEIPYFNSDGSRLRILRYDELNRRFEEIPYVIDLINGKVRGMSSKPGIFVIVE